MPPILDVAIGTVFVFLLFSLVVSAFNELILSFFDSRAKFLQMGLNELLSKDPAAPATKTWFAKIGGILSQLWSALFVRGKPNEWTRALCNHGLVNALSRSKGTNTPSYIASGAFVTALLDLLARRKLPGTPNPSVGNTVPMDIDSLIQAIGDLPDGGLKQSLLSLVAATGRDLSAFKTALEGWFNASMERVSGWYKRFAQKWMVLIGFGLAAAVNVDSIHIIQVLSANPNLAKAVASQAAAYSTNNKPPQAAEDKKKDREKNVAAAKKDLEIAQAAKDPAKEADAQKKLDAALAPATIEEARDEFQKSVARLGNTGIPLGWDHDQLQSLDLEGKTITPSRVWQKRSQILPWLSQHRGQLFLLLAGWALTGLAASLGAPFWFDVLGRFVNVRNSGKAPAEKDPTQSSDTPHLPELNRTPPSPDPPSVPPQAHIANTPALP